MSPHDAAMMRSLRERMHRELEAADACLTVALSKMATVEAHLEMSNALADRILELGRELAHDE